jgi:hypothetical protein
VSLVAGLQSFTLVTKTDPGAPAGNRFLPGMMLPNGNTPVINLIIHAPKWGAFRYADDNQ